MAYEFAISRQVEFAETDMAGIMHFSNFFRYMEAAETAFFRSLGLPLIVLSGEEMMGWPRVRASCDYHHPARFGDVIEVKIFVKEIKIRAIHFFFRFRLTSEDGEPVAIARGEMVTVCATRDPATGQIVSRALPPEVLEKLDQAPPEAWRKG